MLSQEKQSLIEKKDNGRWELSQDAVQAYYYTVIERDSLIKEAKLLREQNDSLKAERSELIVNLKTITETYESNLKESIEAKKEQDQAQENISSYWKKLAGGFQLSAFTRQLDISTIDTQTTQFGLKLDVPVVNKLKLSFQPTIQYESKPRYSLELAYRIF